LTLKEQVDYYSEFEDWYFKIVEDFKFNIEKDREARDILSHILTNKGENWNLEKVLNSFKRLIQSKSTIFIYGSGPSLEITVEELIKRTEKKLFKDCINIAADGAMVLLKEKEIPIHGVFTDLDGLTKSELIHSDFIVVHAHGDNILKIEEFKDELLNLNNIIGTTQVEPINNVINPGGFTDGDRILFFLRSLLLPEQRLFLIGMDFNKIIGKYSKPEMVKDEEGDDVKIKKLQYAVKLIEWLQKQIKNKLYFINSKVVSKEFNNVSIERFKELIQE